MRTTWILEHVPEVGSVLDVGYVGEYGARGHQTIRSHTPGRVVVGVDQDEKRVRALGLERTVAGDGLALPFRDASFACVVLAEVIEHVDEPRSLLREMSRVLRTGGSLIVTTPSPYALSRWLKHWMLARNVVTPRNVRGFLGNPDHKMLFEPLSLCDMLVREQLEPVAMTTCKFSIPLLGRLGKRALSIEIPVFPFNRLGSYVCLVAVRQGR